ncbi:hypothetical protein QVD17_40506 [Tagetes erecta]|uniref:Uncharacterized protein n=1 Tax=Tagetes erecta TaxID=13708 RepID=A0AAD8JQ14_TARER|nr:hypothetical protein QVD17_40506 [Tagetes erecta]
MVTVFFVFFRYNNNNIPPILKNPTNERAKLDNNERLADFVQKLESACVETGKMTDQGSCHLLIHGPKRLLKMDKTCFGSMEAFGGQETVALKVDESLGLKCLNGTLESIFSLK